MGRYAENVLPLQTFGGEGSGRTRWQLVDIDAGVYPFLRWILQIDI